MARTQAADFEQRRDLIVERAAAMFARLGFAGATVADIATACGMSKSLVYHYYPSKEDILYDVMASHIGQLEAEIAASAPIADPRARLRALVHAFMGRYAGAANRQKVLLNEGGSLPPERRALIVRQQKGIVASVSALLAAIEPALAADPARARVQAMLLFGMINWTHTWLDPAGPLSPAQVADMALSLVLREPAYVS